MSKEKELEKVIFKSILKEELSAEERKEFDNWLARDNSNHRILGQMKFALESDFEKEKEKAKKDTWAWLMTRRQSKYGKDYHTNGKFIGLIQFLKIAAVLILISLVGFLSKDLTRQTEPVVLTERLIEKVAMPGQKITTVLPDGTRVKLNSDSKLVVPENFAGNSREVTLTGEAYFEVMRDETKPFQVNVLDGVKVTVLGTSFLVNASNTNENIVAVKSGKVSVKKGKSDESIVLVKDELVRVSESRTLGKKTITDSDIFFGWIDNKLVLEEATFNEIVDVISKWFGYEIEIRLDNSSFDEYSASLTNPGLKEVMESLSHSYKFKYEIDEKNKRILIE